MFRMSVLVVFKMTNMVKPPILTTAPLNQLDFYITEMKVTVLLIFRNTSLHSH